MKYFKLILAALLLLCLLHMPYGYYILVRFVAAVSFTVFAYDYYEKQQCPLNNLEEISCMQKAINFANSRNVCTAIYNINKERNEFEVYSKFDTVIVSQIPSLDRLLSVWLGSFFELKQKVVMEFEKEKQRIGLTEKE